MVQAIRDLYSKHKKILLIAFVSGVLIHGYMMFNKYPNYDEYISMFHYGGGYHLGRWFLALLGNFLFRIDGCYSLPWFNGLLTVAFLAVAIVLFLAPFEIEKLYHNVLLVVMFLAFPTVTATFSYMFTAPFYAFAVLLAALAFYLTVKYRFGFIVSALLLGLSMGIYQAYFNLLAAFLLIYLLTMCIAEKYKVSQIVAAGFRYLGALAGGMAVYFVANIVLTMLQGVSLSSYQGISNMGQYSLSSIMNAIAVCYKTFFSFFYQDYKSLLPYPIMNGLIILGMVITVTCVVWIIIKNGKRNWLKSLFFVAGMAVMPVAVNLICVMCAESMETIHTLMCYGVVLMYFIPLIFQEKIRQSFGQKRWMSVTGVVYRVGIIAVMALYIRFANISYFSYQLYFQQTYSVMQTLSARIQMTPGYELQTPVGFGGVYTDKAAPMWEMRYVDNLAGTYKPAYIINSGAMRANIFKYFLGTAYTETMIGEEILESEEYLAMPVYPDDGSIQRMGDVIVVKFSE